MTDIVARLLAEGENAMRKHLSLGMHSLCTEAADEIERLRAALKAVQYWMGEADIIAGHPGPRVLLVGYPKDDVDAALLRYQQLSNTTETT